MGTFRGRASQLTASTFGYWSDVTFLQSDLLYVSCCLSDGEEQHERVTEVQTATEKLSVRLCKCDNHRQDDFHLIPPNRGEAVFPLG